MYTPSYLPLPLQSFLFCGGSVQVTWASHVTLFPRHQGLAVATWPPSHSRSLPTPRSCLFPCSAIPPPPKQSARHTGLHKSVLVARLFAPKFVGLLPGLGVYTISLIFPQAHQQVTYLGSQLWPCFLRAEIYKEATGATLTINTSLSLTLKLGNTILMHSFSSLLCLVSCQNLALAAPWWCLLPKARVKEVVMPCSSLGSL